MHIFALETDTNKFKKQFLHEGEQEVLTIYNHGFKFFVATFWLALSTLLIIAAAIGVWFLGVEAWIVSVAAIGLWLIFVFPRLLRAFIDWKFDFTFVTTDKLVLVDQSSLFRQRTTPINLENFASVATETQFWNIFPFGKLRFHLKSGLGEDLILPYVSRADVVSTQITNVVTDFQRRKDLRRYGDQDGQ